MHIIINKPIKPGANTPCSKFLEPRSGGSGAALPCKEGQDPKIMYTPRNAGGLEGIENYTSQNGN